MIKRYLITEFNYCAVCKSVIYRFFLIFISGKNQVSEKFYSLINLNYL